MKVVHKCKDCDSVFVANCPNNHNLLSSDLVYMCEECKKTFLLEQMQEAFKCCKGDK